MFGKTTKIVLVFVALAATFVISSGCETLKKDLGAVPAVVKGGALGAATGLLIGDPIKGTIAGAIGGALVDLSQEAARQEEEKKQAERDRLVLQQRRREEETRERLKRGEITCRGWSIESTDHHPRAGRRCEDIQVTEGRIFTNARPGVIGQEIIETVPQPGIAPRTRLQPQSYPSLAPSPGNYSGVTEAPIAFGAPPPPFYNGAPPQPPRRRHVYYQYN